MREYNKMIEELEGLVDVRAYDEAKASGEESKLKSERLLITHVPLAGQYSRIENGKVEPSKHIYQVASKFCRQAGRSDCFYR